MKSDQGIGHIVAGRVGVKATVNFISFGDKGWKPNGIGPGAGGGEAAMDGMESKATDGVNSRLAEDDGWQRRIRDGKKAVVFAGTGSHAPPATGGGSAKLGANGEVLVVPQEENGIVSRVGVKSARLDERIDKIASNAATG